MRPTRQAFENGVADLWDLADHHHAPGEPRNNTGITGILRVVWLLRTVDDAIRQERHAAAYGASGDGYRSILTGLNAADVDSRTHDRHARDLMSLRAGWTHELDSMGDRWWQAYDRLVGSAGMVVLTT